MIKTLAPGRAIGAALACGLLALAGCGAVANAPPTIGVCETARGIDTTIKQATDCDQAAGTWVVRPK